MLYLGADHAGYATKGYIKKFLDKNKIQYKDLSPVLKKGDDYPDHAKKVAKAVIKSKGQGILVCGTGTGMVMAANKFKGIRAVLVYDKYTAVKSREHNDANIITLRARGFSKEKAKELVKVWLKTKFSNVSRHKRRIKKISRI